MEVFYRVGDYIKGIGNYNKFKRFVIVKRSEINRRERSYYPTGFRFEYDIKLIQCDDRTIIGETYTGIVLDSLHFELYSKRENDYLLESDNTT